MGNLQLGFAQTFTLGGRWSPAAGSGNGLHFSGGSTWVRPASFLSVRQINEVPSWPLGGSQELFPKRMSRTTALRTQRGGDANSVFHGTTGSSGCPGELEQRHRSQTLRVNVFGEPCSVSRTSPSSVRPGATGGPFTTTASRTPDVPEELASGLLRLLQKHATWCPSHTVLWPWVWQSVCQTQAPCAGGCVLFTRGAPTTSLEAWHIVSTPQKSLLHE